MLANFLIGLREGLEAALVISVLIAYLVRTGRRELIPRIWAGVALAVLVSLSFGALLTFGPRSMSDEAAETIAGVLSFIAVGFVTWMIFWMAKAARGLGTQLRDAVDSAADQGGWSLAAVALFAVGREGLETALFLWAATKAATTDGGSAATALVGAVLGLAAAAALGWALYRGSLRINLGKFFSWTGVFLILVAAGVLKYGVHEFQEVGLLPGEDNVLFDITKSFSPHTWYASVLKGIFNFSPKVTVLEAIAWLAYVVPALAFFGIKVRGKRSIATSERGNA